MVSAWKPILAALVIFAAGVVTGALCSQSRPWRGPFPANRAQRPDRVESRAWAPLAAEGQLRELSTRMGRVLDLTPAQRDRIQSILRETQDRMKALAAEVEPRTREELRHMREQIRTELTTDQRRKFETLLRLRENRLKRTERNSTTNVQEPTLQSP